MTTTDKHDDDTDSGCDAVFADNSHPCYGSEPCYGTLEIIRFIIINDWFNRP